jgi:hypothetical protein
MGHKVPSAKMARVPSSVETTMHVKKLAFVLALSLTLSACANRPRSAPPPETPESVGLPANPAPVAAPTPGEAEKLDTPNEARRPGFASRLARALGSNSSTANVGACPAVRVLYDAQRFVELDGPERFENVGFTGEIARVSSSCRYVGNDPITINLQMDMAFGKGPKAAGSTKDVVYFVTVTRKDITPISRERFTQRVVIPAGTDRINVQSSVTQIVIPRANKDVSGVNFEVFVGFELTDAQLEFNRDGKRFRIDSGVPR